MLALALGAVWLTAAVTPVAGQNRCGPAGDNGIYACVRGDGESTIVLAAGAGQDSRSWTPVLDELTSLGTIVTFDRPGLGQSPPAEGARSPTVIAGELHAVLESLGVSGPLVLVGHSMGGIHVLRYTELYPESVTGVVLLDTPPPGFEEGRVGLLTPDEQARRRADLAEGRARAPDIVGRERDGAAAEPWTFPDFPSGTPLIVAVADAQYFGELGGEEEHRALWLRLSGAWVRLSTASELVVASGSGHMVHHDRPRLVVDLVRGLVEGARPVSRLPGAPDPPRR